MITTQVKFTEQNQLETNKMKAREQAEQMAMEIYPYGDLVDTACRTGFFRCYDELSKTKDLSQTCGFCVKEKEEYEFELDNCDTCIQMTNHVDGVCQKCKPNQQDKVEKDNQLREGLIKLLCEAINRNVDPKLVNGNQTFNAWIIESLTELLKESKKL